MMWCKRRQNLAFEYFGMVIVGTTGLVSVWSELTSTSGPSEPLASLTQPPGQDCCLGLNCETAFLLTSQIKGRSFHKLAQLWLAAQALTETNYQRLYKELCCTRLPSSEGNGREAGLAMT